MAQNKLLPVIVVGTVVVVGYVGAVTVAKNKVKQVVNTNLEMLEARLESEGHDVTLSYKDVSIHGFSLRPSATVHELHMQINDAQSQTEAVVTTPELQYYPQNFGMTSYRLEIPGEISVSLFAPNQPREQSTLSYDATPAVDVVTGLRNEMSYQLHVPKTVVITTLTENELPSATTTEKDGESEETLPPIDAQSAKTTRMELVQGEPAYVTWKTTESGALIESRTLLRNFAVNYQYDPLITAGQISFDLNQVADDTVEGNQKVNSLLKIENLNFLTIPVLNPVNLTNDISYTGPVVDDKTPLKQDAKLNWQVKDMSLVTGLASVFANGDVSLQPNKERMPYGKLTLRLDDLKKLFTYLAETRPAVVENLNKIRGGLEKISGANIAAGEPATIELAREENGRLQVGKLSLEEAFAVGFEMMVYVPSVLSANPVAPKAAEGELVTPLQGDAASETGKTIEAPAAGTEVPANGEPVKTEEIPAAPASPEAPVGQTPAADAPVSAPVVTTPEAQPAPSAQ